MICKTRVLKTQHKLKFLAKSTTEIIEKDSVAKLLQRKRMFQA